MLRTILSEYGIGWAINRSLYSTRLRLMNVIPATEKLFDKRVDVKRIDIFDLNVNGIKEFLARLPIDKQKELIAIADKATNGIITGFSRFELDYGNPINWHYNPITKAESSKSSKWYRLPDFDTKRGDIKVIWEASRFTHFFYFARVYLITGNMKYYNAFSEQLKQWLKHNPYSYGVNFKCGQECSLRMINALMVYSVFKYCGLVTRADTENVTKLVEICYKKILSNFFYAHKCIKNNHTFSEICGLIVGSWCCKDERGVKKAYELLDKEIRYQFLPDGGYTQYSFNYQRFTLQIIECVYKLSKKTGVYITAKELIKNSVLLMYQVQNEDGDVPNYGSNDGALIFPVTTCGYRDFRPVLNTVYALVEGKRLYELGDYNEELLWFGEEGNLPLADIKRKSFVFSDSGYYTLRHADGFLMTYLQNYKSRPAHMDQLHIDLWHKGINIFCDSGTYSYASELGKVLTLTAAHNTAQVSGIEQMNKQGTFLVYNWTSCRAVKHNNSSFSGTMVSKNGYEHTRRIIKKEYGYEIIDDVICKSGLQECTIYFHTPCHCEIKEKEITISYNGQLLCSLLVKSDDIDVQIIDSKRSTYYLASEDIKCICVKSKLSSLVSHMSFEIRFI